MRIDRGNTVLAAAVLAASLSGCASSGTSGDGDCASRYETLATASTWPQLRSRLVEVEEYGHVTSVRTQAQGGVRGAGRDVVDRVVDLVDDRRHRLVQADVWRDDIHTWQAAVWHQCID